MPVLACPIHKKEWAHGIGLRNGTAGASGEESPKEGAENAGIWEPTVQQIMRFRELRNDWDGFGAEAPSPDLLASAIGLAYCFWEKGVDPPHRVAPGVSGSVILEWQEPDGGYAEVEIDGPLHAEVMAIEPGKPAKQWTIPTE
jgi:hypothetical protein